VTRWLSIESQPTTSRYSPGRSCDRSSTSDRAPCALWNNGTAAATAASNWASRSGRTVFGVDPGGRAGLHQCPGGLDRRVRPEDPHRCGVGRVLEVVRDVRGHECRVERAQPRSCPVDVHDRVAPHDHHRFEDVVRVVRDRRARVETGHTIEESGGATGAGHQRHRSRAGTTVGGRQFVGPEYRRVHVFTAGPIHTVFTFTNSLIPYPLSSRP
jgi:hypothetical protein